MGKSEIFKYIRCNLQRHRQVGGLGLWQITFTFGVHETNRGRNAGFPAPPAQIPACGTTALGSYLG